jgi:large subunit ribosomal protein L21
VKGCVWSARKRRCLLVLLQECDGKSSKRARTLGIRLSATSEHISPRERAAVLLEIHQTYRGNYPLKLTVITMAAPLSKTLKRVVLENRSQLPPTFLLPWTASLSTVQHAPEGVQMLPPSKPSFKRFPLAQDTLPVAVSLAKRTRAEVDSKRAAASAGTPTALPMPQMHTTPLQLSPQVEETLPLLRAQGPHYITAHLYSRPYLLTQGDTLRLPFLMKGVEPGDVLRLDKASNFGSREYTLKAAAPAPKLKSPTTQTTQIVNPTTGHSETHSTVMPSSSLSAAHQAPHFIPHIAKGKMSYLDDRLFVCRAVVMGVESEPMRIKEKTKRRQRKVKTVKSKHSFTVLKVKEVRLATAEEMETGKVLG